MEFEFTSYSLLIAVSVFFVFAAIFVLSSRNKLKDTAPELVHNSRLLSLYHDLRGLSFTLEALIVLLGIIAACLLYGSKFLIMSTAIVIALAEFCKVKASESLAWGSSLPNFFVTLLAIMASCFFTMESLLNINTVIQDSVNGQLEQKQKGLIVLENEIKFLEREIQINDNEMLAINVRQDDVNNDARSKIRELNQEIDTLSKAKEAIVQNNNRALKDRLEQEASFFTDRIRELEGKIIQSEKDLTTAVKNAISQRSIELKNASWIGRQRSVIERAWDEHIKDLRIRNSSTQDRNNTELSEAESALDATRRKLNAAQAMSNDSIQQIRSLDLKINEIEQAKYLLSKTLNPDDKAANDLTNLSQAVLEDKKLLKNLRSQVSVFTTDIMDLKATNQFYRIASMVLAKKAVDLSTQEVKEISGVVMAITGIFLALIPSLLMLSAVCIERKRISLLRNQKPFSAAKKFFSYSKAKSRLKRTAKKDKNNMNKRHIAEMTKLQKRVDLLESHHSEDSKTIKGLKETISTAKAQLSEKAKDSEIITALREKLVAANSKLEAQESMILRQQQQNDRRLKKENQRKDSIRLVPRDWYEALKK